MGLLWTIVIGFLAGLVARAIMGYKEKSGFLVTTLLGIGGAVVATYIGKAIGWYEAGQGAGFIGAIAGSALILWVYHRFIRER